MHFEMFQLSKITQSIIYKQNIQVNIQTSKLVQKKRKKNDMLENRNLSQICVDNKENQ